jgi:succinylarginine dihydrolase
MEIERYKKAMIRSFSDSARMQEFKDNVSGIMNVVIEDDDVGIDDTFTLLKLRSELIARFEGDVKT